MATCKKCGASYGCSCNLIDGFCHTCYNHNISTPSPPLVPEPQHDSTEFERILKTEGLSKEEKLKRINAILENAKNYVST